MNSASGSSLPGISRFPVLAAAVVIQACLGGVYAWSAVAAALRSAYGLTSAQTQSAFGLAIAMQALAMLFGGRWIGRFGTRRVVLCGGLLFGAGYLLSANSGGDFAWILAGSGFLVGLGNGLGYVSALTTVAHWFPRHKGLVIGVTVAGFGIGAIVLSELVSRLLGVGVPVLDVFTIVGCAYAAIIIMAGTLMLPPPLRESVSAARGTGGLVRLGRDGRVLVAGMFCGTFAGLLVIGNLVPLGLQGALTIEWATIAIGCFAIGNTAGRVAWGWLADRFGYRTIPLSLLFMAVVLVGLPALLAHPLLFLSGAVLAGFGFGANFVLYAAQVAALHGTGALTTLYPRIFMAYGVAGITGPTMAGYIHDWTGSYNPAIGIAVVLLLIASWMTFRLPFALPPNPPR